MDIFTGSTSHHIFHRKHAMIVPKRVVVVERGGGERIRTKAKSRYESDKKSTRQASSEPENIAHLIVAQEVHERRANFFLPKK
jgi:hypothetical protein